jgi:excisionase family DNA binding protein
VSDGEWLTTAAAGKRLSVPPDTVVQWVKNGRLVGRRDGDRWRVDPASVDEEQQRVARASWWRRVDAPMGRARGEQQAATKRLIKAAFAWRADPTDPQLTAAMIEAVDERQARSVHSKRGGQRLLSFGLGCWPESAPA